MRPQATHLFVSIDGPNLGRPDGRTDEYSNTLGIM